MHHINLISAPKSDKANSTLFLGKVVIVSPFLSFLTPGLW